MLMFGTKWPSITSTWMRSAPAFSASATCAPSRAKSADRIDGASLIALLLIRILAACVGWAESARPTGRGLVGLADSAHPTGFTRSGGGLLQPGGGGPVHEPDQVAGRRPDHLAGQAVGVGLEIGRAHV